MRHGDFTRLSKHYSAYRPDYSKSVLKAVLALVAKESSHMDIADLGAGTGIFTAANVSYLSGILPEQDRALPVSLHGALTWFLGGLAPVVWGLFLKSGGPTPAVGARTCSA